MPDDVAQGSDLSPLDVSHLAELLDLAQDAILVRALSTAAITYWNRGAERLYGFSRQEALGRPGQSLLHTVFPESPEALDQALIERHYWEGELRQTRKDGNQVVIWSRQATQRDQAGQPVAVLEINSDLTERRRAEAEPVRSGAEQYGRQVAERALARLQILQRVTAGLSEALTAQEVAAVVMGQGIAALEARSGRISLLASDGHAVEVIASAGYTSIRTPLELDESLPTNQVIRSGQPLFAPTYAEIVERFPDIGHAVTPVIAGALASVPLIVEGRVLGAMTLVFEGDRAFEPADRELLTALATQCAQALHRASLYELALTIQEDLRRSRDQLAAILSGIAEGVTVQDETGQLVYANEVAARMTGFGSTDEFRHASSNIVQRYALFDESGQPLAFEQLPGRRLLRGEQPEEIVVQFRDLESGDWRWSILDATAVRDDEGTLRLVVNIFRDITDRKRQSDAIAFLGEASVILGSTLDVSTSLQQLADLAVPRLADLTIIDLFDDERGGKLRRIAVAHARSEDHRLAERIRAVRPNVADGRLARVIRTGRPELAAERTGAIDQPEAGGPEERAIYEAVKPRSAMVVPLQARGHMFGAITFLSASSGRQYSQADLALAEDLGSRAGLALDSARLFGEAQEQAEHQAVLNAALREAVEERDRALVELRQALRTRDEFLASASHDLKNPLASIKATAQLLERRLDRPGAVDLERVRDGLNRVDAIASRASGLVDELLDLARMQMGRPLDLDRQPADLVRLASDATQEQQQTTERHVIQVEATEAQLIGQWDARRLGRVLSNLLDNAVKYSPDGGPISVRVARDGEWAVLEVADHGIGIPSSDSMRIFERFQRASNVERRIGGTGIGLASARHIVESHGGTIAVRSEEGAGSTFIIRLPLGQAPPQPSDGTSE